MRESYIANVPNEKPLFILRGTPLVNLSIMGVLYIFFTLIALLFVIGKYPYESNESINSFLFFLFLFVGACYLDVYLVLTFYSKIEVYSDKLIITNLFLRKRIIPLAQIAAITPDFIFHQKYGQTMFISCEFKFLLTNGETVKIRTSGYEKFYKLAQILVEEFENIRKAPRLPI